MRFRALLNILISYVLLFPPGIANLAANTVSNPVSVLAPPGIAGDVNTNAVSVAPPVGSAEQINGNAVSVVGQPEMIGTLESKPVTVGTPLGSGESLYTNAVSVIHAAADGSYTSWPMSVAVKPEKENDADLVGMWHLDGDGGDSSGNNNHLTPINGASFSTAKKLGTHAASFNGSNTYLRAGSGNNMPTGNSPRTFMAWIKPFSYPDGTYNGIFAYGQMICTGKGSLLSIKNDGRLSASFWCNDAYQTVGPAATLNDWNHVAMTYDGGKTVKFYMNGQFIQESTLGAGTAANTQGGSIRIGSTDDPGRVFNGLIDEVAVYKRALTAEEIALHAKEGPIDPLAPPPPVFGNVPRVVGTSSILLSGTKTSGTSGTGTAIWVNSKKIYDLDTSDIWQGAYSGLIPGMNLLNAVAVDDQYRQSAPTSAMVIYDNQPPVIESSVPANNSDAAKPVSSVLITFKDTYSDINTSASFSAAVVTNSSSQIMPGTWYTSGSKSIMFASTSPLPRDTYTVTVYPVDSVGNRGQQQITFRTYDLTPPTTKISLSGAKDIDGWYTTPVTVTLTADDGQQGSGVDRTEYSTDNGSTWQTYQTPFTLNDDGVTALRFRSVDRAANFESSQTSDIKINKTRLVGLWHMDNDWQDSSVVGNNPTIVSNATFSSNAKIGSHAGGFNGSNSYVSIPDSPTLRAERNITVLGWIYVKAFDKTWQNIFWKGNTPDCTTNCENREYVLWLNSAGYLTLASTPDDRIGIGQLTLNTPSGIIKTAANTPANNGWHHFAAIISSDQNMMKIYVNGVEQASGSYSMTDIRDTSGPLYIGNNPTWNSTFNGLIDELTIYKRVLTPQEIQENYRNYVIAQPTIDPAPPTVTNVAALDLAGTKPENTAIMINGVEVVSLNTNTTWQGTYTLTPGMNMLNVTAMDAEGFHSAALPLSVALDNAAPNVTGTIPSDHAFVNTAVNAITFNLSDSFSPLDLEATVSGASVIKAGGAGIAGGWSLSGTGASGTVTFTPLSVLEEGTYTATIYPTDNFLHQSTFTITFTVDSTPPAAPLFDQPTLLTRNSSIIVTGTKSPDTAQLVLTGTGLFIGAVSYPSPTTWSAVVSGLNQGTYSLTAYGLDSAGNQSGSNIMTITVDRTPPGKPTVTYPELTKETAVTLSGAKPQNTYLYVNSQLTSNNYAAATWSYAVSLSEGSNQFSIYTKDEAGNASDSVLATVVRDTAPPVVGASSPAANSFVNAVTAITVTLSDIPAGVDLNASSAGAEVKVSNAAVTGSWTVSGSELVFTPAAALSDGLYTVTFPNATDLLSNKGTVSFSFTLDTGVPVAQSLTMNPTSPHKAEAVKFTVTFNEDMLTSIQPALSFTRGAIYSTYTIPSGNWTTSKTWQGSYTFTVDTGDGVYSVKITGAKDKSGNAMNEMSIPDAFVLDTTAPSAPVVNPVTTPTNNRNQIITGSKEAGAAVFINGTQRVAADANATWSYNYPLAENTNTLNITARDAAGNDSPATTATIVLDTTPPTFTVNAYQNPSSTATQKLTGTKEPGCIVKLNGTQIFGPEDSSPTWSYTVDLVSGITNRFVFSAADTLGNTTTKPVEIFYDNAPPAALGPGILIADGSGKGTEITLSWTAYPETADVAYYAVYKSLTSFTDVTGMTPIGTVNKGVKTYKATGLIQGTTYYFAVVPVDLAGNQINTVNIASAAPADTVAPEDVTKLAAAAGYTTAQGNVVTLTWIPSVNSTGDLADQIVYVDAGTGYDSGTPVGKTATTYAKTGLNDATKYKFKITVKDTLGHESQGAIVEAVTRLSNPASLTANPGNGKVVLSWTAVSSPYLKQYNIYRKTTTTQQTDISTMTLIGTVARTATTYTDSGLTNDTTYQYAVTVLNTSGAERADVQSISATTRADSTGPVIDTLTVIAGQIVSVPITISATAHDVESTMGGMEFSVDGTIVASQSGGSISYFWNVVAATDGNHTIKLKATDSKGNATEDSRQVIVSLAPPAIPIITGHVISQTTPTYLVNVSGTAPLFTTVTLKVNGIVVGTTQTIGTTGTTGAFSFSSVALVEGDNLVAARASHRGGESAYTPDYKILVDTGAPTAPQNLAAQVLPGGLIRFTWTNGTGELPASYNLYSGSSTFTSNADAGVAKTNTSPITYQYKEYNPGDDSVKYYAVTAIDAAGNESGISNVVSVSSDRTPPSVLDILYTQNSATIAPNSAVGIGDVKVSITVSEPLKELPFFSLEPQEGSPIVVTMAKVDDTRYQGIFTITAQSAQGPTTYKFSGKDMVGNRGNAQGTGITIDVKGPEVSIQSPISTLRITPDPVTVNFVLNEPSETTPVLQLKAADGTTSLVSSMTSSDNGVHWFGTLNVSGMPEGKAEFILSEAKDLLGNIGTTVNSGRYLLLYLNSVPSPGIPEGLAATSGKGGAVTLTWYPVVNPYADLATLTYNLYRRAEGEATATKIQTGIGSQSSINNQQSTIAVDIPPVDGTYYYSVTSVGLLDSESPASAEVQAVSDRTGPPAPQNLLLALGSGGVTATWDAVVDVDSALGTPNSALPLKGYHLYRSNASFTSSDGLTPVAKTPISTAVDTSPSKTYRFYAVAAVDSLGNEGPLSDCREIDFPVSPVRNLALQRIDDAAPTITWLAPQDGSIAGYHIYRNGSRITPYPVPNLSYTDGYAVVNTTYGVSAVDNLGNESPVKQVTLPDLAMGLKDGTTLRRGVLETLQIILTSGQLVPTESGGSGFTIDSLDVKVGTAPSSSILGPFVLGANTTLQLEKIAATTADALSPVSVLIQANWSPSPGVAVKVSRTTSAEVLGSSSSLEIFNDPLVRNTDGKVRLKVNNIGTAQMEIVTSENNTRTAKVRVNLKDQDGNLLSTGYLDQRIGTAIVNGAGYAVARINPNETFLTDPIMLPVPVSAPYKVIIEAVIENTYYHYAKTDQVTAPGMKGTTESYIQETAYRAIAAPEKTFYATAQPVVINGSAISNDPAANGQLVPNVPVKLGISVRGFDRFYTVTTDATGKFTYTFTPGSNEAGTYSVWAVHPDVKDRTVQATFSIAGFTINPGTAYVKMARNRTLDIPVTLMNYGGGTLTGLTFETTASTGISVGVINPGDTQLTAGENQGITFRISTDSTAPDTAWATMTAKTTEGLSVKLNANITVVSLIPIISTSPSYIDTGMVRGDQKIATFTIKNTGQETLKNARIEGPSTSWMSLTQDKIIGDIVPGASTSVSFMFSPPATLSQGVYDDQVVIYSDNHMAYTYHIQVTVTSSAVGNVLFDVLNILSEDVPNATITFQHQSLPELIYTVKTGSDGTAMKYDIPEGRYSYTVSPPPGHLPTSGTFTISAGLTTSVYITLEVKLVDVTWSVVPTTIQDQYEIQISQTFATNVPVPVLVTDPASVTVPELQAGQVFNGEFTVTNYGLIAADHIKVNYPTSFQDYDIEIMLSTIPNSIPAMGKITVPYRVTRRAALASISGTVSNQYACNSELQTPDPQLLNEVQGYGAGCVTSASATISGDYVQCPNTPQQTTGNASTGFQFGFQQTCGSGTSAGTYIQPTQINPVAFGNGTGSQTTSGSQLPPQPSILETGKCEEEQNKCVADASMGETTCTVTVGVAYIACCVAFPEAIPACTEALNAGLLYCSSLYLGELGICRQNYYKCKNCQ